MGEGNGRGRSLLAAMPLPSLRPATLETHVHAVYQKGVLSFVYTVQVDTATDEEMEKVRQLINTHVA